MFARLSLAVSLLFLFTSGLSADPVTLKVSEWRQSHEQQHRRTRARSESAVTRQDNFKGIILLVVAGILEHALLVPVLDDVDGRQKDDGRLVLRRGFRIGKGERWVGAEDVVTRGGRVQETVDIVTGDTLLLTSTNSTTFSAELAQISRPA